MSQVPTTEQLQQSLLQAFADKADAEAKVKEADLNIVALRNLLTGIRLAGQQAAAAAQAASTPPQGT